MNGWVGRLWLILLWAVLVGIIEVLKILTEGFLARLACKDHFETFLEFVLHDLIMAFSTIEPFLAAWRADSDLSVEDMLAHEKGVVRWFAFEIERIFCRFRFFE